ncbi:MAG: hypothetical protein JJU28_16455 [Cyclobacteriaceae bacterium]|nr:hypothetical protein [Cyclobacteriaceae bacterium]
MKAVTTTALLTLLLSNVGFAQWKLRSEITGHWKVAGILSAERSLSKEQQTLMQEFMDVFIQSEYYFHEDGAFDIIFHKELPEIMFDLKSLNKTLWKYDAEIGLIEIGTPDDGYSMMRIFVRDEDGKLYFLIHDTPLIMEMQKVN